MTRELGRVGGGQAGRLAGRWAGGFVAALLSIATPAAAFQQAARPATTAVPTAARTPVTPTTHAECLRAYAVRRDAAAYCQRRFPTTTPAATTSSTTAPATTTPTAPAPTREPVDITPQLNKLFEAWQGRPRTPPKSPADPLAVVPEIQAACAAYASVPERWRRCVADAWRAAGLRGQPPLVLQNPPVAEPPPPVVQPVPPVQPPTVVSKPPVQTPTAKTVESEPVVQAEPPSVAAVEPPSPPKSPPIAGAAPPAVQQASPSPKPPASPLWFWLIALVAAAGGGFGLAKLLNRGRSLSSAKAAPAPCVPEIALIGDPGVVVLTPDGPPRAGMAVSLRIEHAPDGGQVRLDYPTLETAP